MMVVKCYSVHMKVRISTVLIIALYFAIWIFLAFATVSRPADQTFGGDADGYHQGAVSLVQEGAFNYKGAPNTEREPGQSVFLAIAYEIGGIGNRYSAFVLQALLYLGAALFLVYELRKVTSDRTGTIALALLLILPSAFHVLFTLNREHLALSLFMIVAACFLRLQREHSWKWAIIAAVSLAAIILTYVPYVLFPIFIIPLFWIMKLPKKYLPAIVAVPLIAIGVWAARNYSITGQPCLFGCYRSAVQWAVRGEQMMNLRGLEPLRCFYAEYISRDYTGRSPFCNFNAVQHELWPQGLYQDDRDLALAATGKAKIKENFGRYLWYSTIDVVELHIPYVNGWGRIYNISAALSSLILYVGVLLSLPFVLRRKTFLFFIAAMVYTIGVFSLTDATPRYLMPVIFAYAVLAAIGYERVWSRFRG